MIMIIIMIINAIEANFNRPTAQVISEGEQSLLMRKGILTGQFHHE